MWVTLSSYLLTRIRNSGRITFWFLFIVTISGPSCNQLLCRTCEIHDPHPQNFPDPHPIAFKISDPGIPMLCYIPSMSTIILQCAITEVSFGCWCAEKYPFFFSIHLEHWQQQSAASLMCCISWRICTNGLRIESAPSVSSMDKICYIWWGNKQSCLWQTELSLHLSLFCILHSEKLCHLLIKIIPSLRNCLKAPGQLLQYFISEKNTSVNGCGNGVIFHRKSRKKIKPEQNICGFLLALAPRVAWVNFRHFQLVDPNLLQDYWNYWSLKWAMDQGQFGSQYAETGTIYLDSH